MAEFSGPFPRRASAANSAAYDIAALLLRLLVGGLTILHGINKIATGPGGILALVAKTGLPTEFGYLVYVGEVIAPAMLIIGWWTRPAALVIAINMLVAVLLVHTGQLLQLSQPGGWALELQAFYLFVPVAVALLGAGRYSVGGARGRWN